MASAARNSTDRSRRHRQRVRDGTAPIQITIGIIPVSELLIDYRLLAEWDADDHQKVADAIERLLELLVAEHTGR